MKLKILNDLFITLSYVYNKNQNAEKEGLNNKGNKKFSPKKLKFSEKFCYTSDEEQAEKPIKKPTKYEANEFYYKIAIDNCYKTEDADKNNELVNVIISNLIDIRK